MSFTSTTRFELHGEFGGFIRNREGKRRLVLRVAGESIRLRVPKELRHQLDESIRDGNPISVAGIELRDEFTGQIKRTVSHLRVHGKPAFASEAPKPEVIRICAEKNCWRSGGKELWSTLERAIEQTGSEDAVRLKAVGCLGNCGRAPNLRCDGRTVSRCSTAAAAELLTRLTAGAQAVTAG